MAGGVGYVRLCGFLVVYVSVWVMGFFFVFFVVVVGECLGISV